MNSFNLWLPISWATLPENKKIRHIYLAKKSPFSGCKKAKDFAEDLPLHRLVASIHGRVWWSETFICNSRVAMASSIEWIGRNTLSELSWLIVIYWLIDRSRYQFDAVSDSQQTETLRGNMIEQLCNTRLMKILWTWLWSIRLMRSR